MLVLVSTDSIGSLDVTVEEDGTEEGLATESDDGADVGSLTTVVLDVGGSRVVVVGVVVEGPSDSLVVMVELPSSGGKLVVVSTGGILVLVSVSLMVGSSV